MRKYSHRLMENILNTQIKKKKTLHHVKLIAKNIKKFIQFKKKNIELKIPDYKSANRRLHIFMYYSTPIYFFDEKYYVILASVIVK